VDDDSILIQIEADLFMRPAMPVIRMKPEDHLAELGELLTESEIEYHRSWDDDGATSTFIGHSYEVILVVLTNAAVWTALAGVLKTFINRHRNKKVKFNPSWLNLVRRSPDVAGASHVYAARPGHSLLGSAAGSASWVKSACQPGSAACPLSRNRLMRITAAL
jgi:hypothetical protein